jgi:hypothetical protein
LFFPHPLPSRVDRLHQIEDIALGKTAGEVSARRWVRNALRSQPVEEGLVVAPQFDVLETHSFEHRVVGKVEHVIALVVGQVALEQMKPPVDLLPQPDPLNHQVDCTDAPAVNGATAPGHLVVDVAGSHHRLGLVAPRFIGIQPMFDSALAIAEDFYVSSLHSKCSLSGLLTSLDSRQQTKDPRAFRAFSYRLSYPITLL